ncbi:hypothetical protein [Porphyrobacter sp. MBR-49]
MDKDIMNAAEDEEGASDALKLLAASFALLSLGYFTFQTWNGSSDRIATMVSLFSAIPFTLVVFSTIMAISTKSVAHIEMAMKLIKVFAIVLCSIFLIIAFTFFYLGAIFYSGQDIMSVIEIALLPDLTLETKRWALFLSCVIFVLCAGSASLMPKVVRYFWSNPLSRKVIRFKNI